MGTGKKLLVLMDGSERALQTAAYLKAFMPVDADMKIVLFHVSSGMTETYREMFNEAECAPAVDSLNDLLTEEQIGIRTHLETARNRLIDGGFPESSVEIKLQPLVKGVAQDIIDEAGNGYTAVVLRRRGMGALQRIIVGSVAVKLLQVINFIPLIFVGQAPPVKKILLAVDGSPSSIKAVEFLGALAGTCDCEVCIFHAIPGLGRVHFDLDHMRRLKGVSGEMEEDCVEAFKIKISKMFQDARNILTASGMDAGKITEKIVPGVLSRSEAIINEAEEGGYGAIVVGRRGLSRVEAFFMGRVGHKVIYGGSKFTLWIV